MLALMTVLTLLAATGQASPQNVPDGAMTTVPSAIPTEYLYPGATTEGGGNGGEFAQAKLTTPDPPRQVIGYYESQFGQRLSADCFHGVRDHWVASCVDSREVPEGQAGAGGVSLHVLTRKQGSEVLTIVISRLPGESRTHLVVFRVTEKCVTAGRTSRRTRRSRSAPAGQRPAVSGWRQTWS